MTTPIGGANDVNDEADDGVVFWPGSRRIFFSCFFVG